MKLLFLVSLSLASAALAGTYPPAAGKTGTDAIPMGDSRFVNWASGYSSIIYGSDVDAEWKTPAKACGPATGVVYDIVSLGNRGRITMWFPHPVTDGDGADFAVFENSFSDGFLELAWVEVSSDGVNFFRFPNVSLTPSKVGPFATVDPTNLSGLAGKYRAGYGTPFDLAAIPDSATFDRKNVRFVRIVDIAGDGSETDSEGHVIYDPYPTSGSTGFDLEAIGVIHQNDGDFRVLRAEKNGDSFLVEWQSNPGSSYRIEKSSPDLTEWQTVETVTGAPAAAVLARTLSSGGAARCFWRIVRTGG